MWRQGEGKPVRAVDARFFNRSEANLQHLFLDERLCSEPKAVHADETPVFGPTRWLAPRNRPVRTGAAPPSYGRTRKPARGRVTHVACVRTTSGARMRLNAYRGSARTLCRGSRDNARPSSPPA